MFDLGSLCLWAHWQPQELCCFAAGKHHKLIRYLIGVALQYAYTLDLAAACIQLP